MGRVRNTNFKRAAVCAALSVLTIVSAMPWSRVPAFLTYITSAHARMRVEPLTIETAGGGEPRKFQVEMATTDQEKSVGLMFRTSLADDAGMLFPYGPPQEITMWMRNTYIPLDMVFIHADGTIARIEANTEPLSEAIISSGSAVSAVLEIAGGAASRLGIKPGDIVRHPFFKPAGDAPKTPEAPK